MILLQAITTVVAQETPPPSVWPAFKDLVQAIWTSGNVGAFATCTVAFVAIYAIRANRKQTRDNLLKGLVDSYVALKRYEAEAFSATAANNSTLARELQTRYYEGLIDLHWMEYQLWRRKSLDNALFWTWAENRRTMHQANAQVNGVQFQAVWASYSTNAFPPGAPTSKYVPLMNKVFASGTASLRKWNALSTRVIDFLFFWERRWLKGV